LPAIALMMVACSADVTDPRGAELAGETDIDAGATTGEEPGDPPDGDPAGVSADAASTPPPRQDAAPEARTPVTDADAGAARGDASAAEADLQFCVDENNRYRATLGVPPLTRSAKLEQFAQVGARLDYEARTAHQHFTASKGVPGAQRSAENEIPGFSGWSLRQQKTVHAVIAAGLASMWAEGPGGGHYENMKNAALHNVGCGVFIAANVNQDVTVTIDFTN